jgi:hypothetical protein
MRVRVQIQPEEPDFCPPTSRLTVSAGPYAYTERYRTDLASAHYLVALLEHAERQLGARVFADLT